MLVIPLAVLQDSILGASNRALAAKLTRADPIRVATKRATARVANTHRQLCSGPRVLDSSAGPAAIETTRRWG